MSENTEMYLITIVMLQEDGQPVPLPALAQALDISPVSTNEMCRKLSERDLVDYQPYKGVTLTAKGDLIAQQILRRRRLWEVFLVDELGVEPQEAEEMACNLEHATTDLLAQRLVVFLNHPTMSPQNQPILYDHFITEERPVRPLASLTSGKHGRVVNVVSDEMVEDFLLKQGVVTGEHIEVLAVSGDGSLLLRAGDQQISLSQTIAAQVDVEPTSEMEP